MKKIIIVIAIVVVAIGSIDPYCNYIIDKGFSEKKPDKCLSGALLKQRMFKYRSAISTYKKMLKRFPDFHQQDKIHYYLAHCYEKDDNAQRAIEEYEFLISRFPDSQHVDIAKKKLSNLKANSTSNDI